MTLSRPSPDERFAAFVSYRHVEPDRAWARWLQAGLERYRVPRRLARESGLPRRIGRVFRDDEELAASSDLSAEIRDALARADNLVVVCSPRTPASEWVNAEVEAFVASGRADRVHLLLIEGEPEQAFPKACRPHIARAGAGESRIDRAEPLAADARPAPGERVGRRRRIAKLRLLAAILGCRFDELWQRERERRRQLVGAAAVGVVAVLALTVAAGWYWHEARAQEEVARSRTLSATAVGQLEERLDRALLLAVEAHRTADTIEAWDALLRALERAPRLASVLRGGLVGVQSVAWSPDGRTIAASDNRGQVRLWDVVSGVPVGGPLTGHQGFVMDVAWGFDGQMVASGGEDGTVRLWNAGTGTAVGEPLVRHNAPVRSVVFSPDGRLLASSSHDLLRRTPTKTGISDGIVIWDVATRRPVADLVAAGSGGVESLAFSPDSKVLASGRWDRTIVLWDVAAREPLGPPLAGHRSIVRGVAFAPDGRILASGGDDGAVLLWDLTDRPKLRNSLSGHTFVVNDVAFSPDGHKVASAGGDGRVLLWDVTTGKPLGEPLEASSVLSSRVSGVAFSPDGRTLAAATTSSVILWNVEQPSFFEGHAVAFSPDGRVLASGTSAGEVVLWHVAGRRRVAPPMDQHSAPVEALAFSLNGAALASGSQDGRIVLWDVTKDPLVGRRLTDHPGGARSLAFTPDGTKLASGGGDGRVVLWETASGKPAAKPISVHQGAVRHVAISPDGKLLASGGEDKRAYVWRIDGRVPLGLPTFAATVHTIRFSPDGSTLAVGMGCEGGYSHTLLFDVADLATAALDGRRPREFKGHAIAFSPDGTLATGGWDECRQIMLWDLATMRMIGPPLSGHAAAVAALAFSPDGRRLASADEDGSVIVREVLPEALRDRACRMANRNLSPEEWDQNLPWLAYRKTCSGIAAPLE